MPPQVGFLCHLSDPAGFTIELLQHTHERNFVKLGAEAESPELALGQPAVLGQITTRSTDIEVTLATLYETSSTPFNQAHKHVVALCVCRRACTCTGTSWA